MVAYTPVCYFSGSVNIRGDAVLAYKGYNGVKTKIFIKDASKKPNSKKFKVNTKTVVRPRITKKDYKGEIGSAEERERLANKVSAKIASQKAKDAKMEAAIRKAIKTKQRKVFRSGADLSSAPAGANSRQSGKRLGMQQEIEHGKRMSLVIEVIRVEGEVAYLRTMSTLIAENCYQVDIEVIYKNAARKHSRNYDRSTAMGKTDPGPSFTTFALKKAEYVPSKFLPTQTAKASSLYLRKINQLDQYIVQTMHFERIDSDGVNNLLLERPTTDSDMLMILTNVNNASPKAVRELVGKAGIEFQKLGGIVYLVNKRLYSVGIELEPAGRIDYSMVIKHFSKPFLLFDMYLLGPGYAPGFLYGSVHVCALLDENKIEAGTQLTPHTPSVLQLSHRDDDVLRLLKVKGDGFCTAYALLAVLKSTNFRTVKSIILIDFIVFINKNSSIKRRLRESAMDFIVEPFDFIEMADLITIVSVFGPLMIKETKVSLKFDTWESDKDTTIREKVLIEAPPGSPHIQFKMVRGHTDLLVSESIYESIYGNLQIVEDLGIPGALRTYHDQLFDEASNLVKNVPHIQIFLEDIEAYLSCTGRFYLGKKNPVYLKPAELLKIRTQPSQVSKLMIYEALLSQRLIVPGFDSGPTQVLIGTVLNRAMGITPQSPPEPESDAGLQISTGENTDWASEVDQLFDQDSTWKENVGSDSESEESDSERQERRLMALKGFNSDSDLGGSEEDSEDDKTSHGGSVTDVENSPKMDNLVLQDDNTDRTADEEDKTVIYSSERPESAQSHSIGGNQENDSDSVFPESRVIDESDQEEESKSDKEVIQNERRRSSLMFSLPNTPLTIVVGLDPIGDEQEQPIPYDLDLVWESLSQAMIRFSDLKVSQELAKDIWETTKSDSVRSFFGNLQKDLSVSFVLQRLNTSVLMMTPEQVRCAMDDYAKKNNMNCLDLLALETGSLSPFNNQYVARIEASAQLKSATVHYKIGPIGHVSLRPFLGSEPIKYCDLVAFHSHQAFSLFEEIRYDSDDESDQGELADGYNQPAQDYAWDISKNLQDILSKSDQNAALKLVQLESVTAESKISELNQLISMNDTNDPALRLTLKDWEDKRNFLLIAYEILVYCIFNPSWEENPKTVLFTSLARMNRNGKVKDIDEAIFSMVEILDPLTPPEITEVIDRLNSIGAENIEREVFSSMENNRVVENNSILETCNLQKAEKDLFISVHLGATGFSPEEYDGPYLAFDSNFWLEADMDSLFAAPLLIPTAVLAEINVKFRPHLATIRRAISINEFYFCGEMRTVERGDDLIVQQLRDSGVNVYFFTKDKDLLTKASEHFKCFTRLSDLEKFIVAPNSSKKSYSSSFSYNISEYGPSGLNDYSIIDSQNVFLTELLGYTPVSIQDPLPALTTIENLPAIKSRFMENLGATKMDFDFSTDEQIDNYDNSLVNSVGSFDPKFERTIDISIEGDFIESLIRDSIRDAKSKLEKSNTLRHSDPRPVIYKNVSEADLPDSQFPDVMHTDLTIRQLFSKIQATFEPKKLHIDESFTKKLLGRTDSAGNDITEGLVVSDPDTSIPHQFDRKDSHLFRFFDDFSVSDLALNDFEQRACLPVIGESHLCKELNSAITNRTEVHHPFFDRLCRLLVHVIEAVNRASRLKNKAKFIFSDNGFKNMGYIVPPNPTTKTLSSKNKFRLWFVVESDWLSKGYHFYPEIVIPLDSSSVLLISRQYIMEAEKIISISRLYPSIEPFKKFATERNFQLFFWAIFFCSSMTKGVFSSYKYLNVVFHSDYCKFTALSKKYFTGVPKRAVDILVLRRIQENLETIFNEKKPAAFLGDPKTLVDMLESNNLYSAPPATTKSRVHDYQNFYDDILNNLRSRSENCTEEDFVSEFSEKKHVSIPAISWSVQELTKNASIRVDDQAYVEFAAREFHAYFVTTTNGTDPGTLQKKKNAVIFNEVLALYYSIYHKEGTFDFLHFIDWSIEMCMRRGAKALISIKPQKDVANREIVIQDFFTKASHFHLQTVFKYLDQKWPNELVTKSEFEKLERISKMNFRSETAFCNDDMAKWSGQDIKVKFDLVTDLIARAGIVTPKIHTLLKKSLLAVKDITLLFDDRLKRPDVEYATAKSLAKNVNKPDTDKKNVKRSKLAFTRVLMTHGWPQGLMHFFSSFVHGLATLYTQKIITIVVPKINRSVSLFHSDDKNTAYESQYRLSDEDLMGILKVNAMTPLAFSLGQSKTKPSLTYYGSSVDPERPGIRRGRKISEMVSVYNVEGIILNSYLRQCATVFSSLVHRSFVDNHLEILSRCCTIFNLSNSLIEPELLYSKLMSYLKFYYSWPKELAKSTINAGGTKETAIVEIARLGIRGDNYFKYQMHPGLTYSQVNNPVLSMPPRITKKVKNQVKSRIALAKLLMTKQLSKRSLLRDYVLNEFHRVLKNSSGVFLSSRDSLYFNFFRHRREKSYRLFNSVSSRRQSRRFEETSASEITAVRDFMSTIAPEIGPDDDGNMSLDSLVDAFTPSANPIIDESVIGDKNFKTLADNVLFLNPTRIEIKTSELSGVVRRFDVGFGDRMNSDFDDAMKIIEKGVEALHDISLTGKYNTIVTDVSKFVTTYRIRSITEFRNSRPLWDFVKKIGKFRSPIVLLWKNEEHFSDCITHLIPKEEIDSLNEDLVKLARDVLTRETRLTTIPYQARSKASLDLISEWVSNAMNSLIVDTVKGKKDALDRFIKNIKILERVDSEAVKRSLTDRPRSRNHAYIYSFVWRMFIELPMRGLVLAFEDHQSDELVYIYFDSNKPIGKLVQTATTVFIEQTIGDIEASSLADKVSGRRFYQRMTAEQIKSYSSVKLEPILITSLTTKIINGEVHLDLTWINKSSEPDSRRSLAMFEIEVDVKRRGRYFYGSPFVDNSEEVSRVETDGKNIKVFPGENFDQDSQIKLPDFLRVPVIGPSMFTNSLINWAASEGLVELCSGFNCPRCIRSEVIRKRSLPTICTTTGQSSYSVDDFVPDLSDFSAGDPSYKTSLVQKKAELKVKLTDLYKNSLWRTKWGRLVGLYNSLKVRYDIATLYAETVFDAYSDKMSISLANRIYGLLKSGAYAIAHNRITRKMFLMRRRDLISISLGEINPNQAEMMIVHGLIPQDVLRLGYMVFNISERDAEILRRSPSVMMSNVVQNENHRASIKRASECRLLTGDTAIINAIVREMHDWFDDNNPMSQIPEAFEIVKAGITAVPEKKRSKPFKPAGGKKQPQVKGQKKPRPDAYITEDFVATLNNFIRNHGVITPSSFFSIEAARDLKEMWLNDDEEGATFKPDSVHPVIVDEELNVVAMVGIIGLEPYPDPEFDPEIPPTRMMNSAQHVEYTQRMDSSIAIEYYDFFTKATEGGEALEQADRALEHSRIMEISEENVSNAIDYAAIDSSGDLNVAETELFLERLHSSDKFGSSEDIEVISSSNLRDVERFYTRLYIDPPDFSAIETKQGADNSKLQGELENVNRALSVGVFDERINNELKQFVKEAKASNRDENVRQLYIVLKHFLRAPHGREQILDALYYCRYRILPGGFDTKVEQRLGQRIRGVQTIRSYKRERGSKLWGLFVEAKVDLTTPGLETALYSLLDCLADQYTAEASNEWQRKEILRTFNTLVEILKRTPEQKDEAIIKLNRLERKDLLNPNLVAGYASILIQKGTEGLEKRIKRYLSLE